MQKRRNQLAIRIKSHKWAKAFHITGWSGYVFPTDDVYTRMDHLHSKFGMTLVSRTREDRPLLGKKTGSDVINSQSEHSQSSSDIVMPTKKPASNTLAENTCMTAVSLELNLRRN